MSSKIELDFIRGVVYSKFEDVGPVPKNWFPDLDVGTRQLIALKTINLLAGEKGKIPSELAIVPLPKMKKISIVKYIEIPDKSARGSAWDASVTVLFDQDFLPFIHKYIDKFSEAIDRLSETLLKAEKKKNKEMLLSKTISNFYFEFDKNIKTYISTEELQALAPPDERLIILRRTIEQFQGLIKEFIENSEGFSQKDLKDALKLSYELSMLDLEEVTSKKIREIAKFAEKLRRKKEMLAIKQKKMAEISNKLNNGMKTGLNEQLETITDVFDEFLGNLEDSMRKLSDKGSSILFFKKIYDSGETEAKILATSKELKRYIKFLKTINNLPPYEFTQVKKFYIQLEKMRTLKKLRDVGKYAHNIGDVLHLERKKVLKLTRDTRLKESLNEIFKIAPESRNNLITEEKIQIKIPKVDEKQISKEKKTKKRIKSKK